MQLTHVSMCDFRSFKGLHEIDLVPRTKYGAKRPIILFGGLNGAGKTSILTAVRLALYGKLILGNRAGRKEYESFLSESIHKNANVIAADGAHVEIQFDYGKLGERHHYRVQRAWTQRSASVEERLRIWRNGEPLRGIDRDDAQAFLNELVPLGVADLFFFDGEKLAELAEDRDGSALGDAIRRLVGIDLVERLRADLGVYVRKTATSRADAREQRKLERLVGDYESAKTAARQLKSELTDAHQILEELETKVVERERALVNLGGRWAEGRESEQSRINELTHARVHTEAELREYAGGLLPLALAGEALTAAVADAAAEHELMRKHLLAVELNELASRLLPEAASHLSKKGTAWLASKLRDELAHYEGATRFSDSPIRFDVSQSELQHCQRLLSEFLPETREQAGGALKRLSEINDSLDVAGLRLERAPDERSIEQALDALRAAQQDREEQAQAVAELRARCKEAYRQALQQGRELKKVEDRLTDQTATERPVAYARQIRALLLDYGSKIAEAKVTDLEQEFAAAFQRLARKEDLSVRTRIDPGTYQVSLLDERGNVINKQQLSAGERQIYAIAMLEALAHTSGRRLPVIIDTPLGRLDSKHRSKLVDNYFPRASHQVVILSTDTEVDQSFYSDLSRDISHAYEIYYDPVTRSSALREGYFWKQLESYREAG